jgi:hypothetical protein
MNTSHVDQQVMPAHQLLADLSQLIELIWTTDFGDTDFKRCKTIAAELKAELEVYGAFTDTTKWLRTTSTEDKSYKKTCAARKTRISKMVKAVEHGSPKPSARFQKLGQLDVETLMFIGASYTVLEITKLAEETFECLIKMGSKRIPRTALPTNWVLREEFQVAVAESAELGGTLKRSMYAHSFSP